MVDAKEEKKVAALDEVEEPKRGNWFTRFVTNNAVVIGSAAAVTITLGSSIATAVVIGKAKKKESLEEAVDLARSEDTASIKNPEPQNGVNGKDREEAIKQKQAAAAKRAAVAAKSEEAMKQKMERADDAKRAAAKSKEAMKQKMERAAEAVERAAAERDAAKRDAAAKRAAERDAAAAEREANGHTVPKLKKMSTKKTNATTVDAIANNMEQSTE